MTIEERIKNAEQRFNELDTQRNSINEEMAKLQGEWRVLQDMLKEQESSDEPNKEAAVIEAVPEEESK